jgi:hypothetical protein
MLRRFARACATTTTASARRGYARGARAPPPPIRAVSDVWEEVIDERSGRHYWWNVDTDETTEVGAPKPTTYSALDPSMPAPAPGAGARAPPPSAYDQQQGSGGGFASGFGGMIAQGAAWGMGSSLGHRAIGGIFGGGTYGGGASSGADGLGGGAAPQPPVFGESSSEFDDIDDGDGGGLFDFFSED